MKQIYQTIIILLFSISINAQEDQVKFDNVEVIKEFSAKLGDFNKIDLEPTLPVFDLKSRRYEYNIRAIPVKLEYEKPTIRPLALPDPIVKHINNYRVKLGYGVPKFLNAELSIGMLKNNMNSNISLKHMSANNSVSISDQRDSKTGIDFTYFNRKNELDIEYGINGLVDGSYNYLYATEINKIDSFSTADNKRRFLRGNFNVFAQKDGLFNLFDNKLEVNYKFLQLNSNKKLENTIGIKNTIDYNFNQYTSISLPIEFDFITGEQIYLMKTTPHFVYSTRLFYLKIGGDLGKSQNQDFIYPSAKISSNLFNNFIEIFASVDNQIFNNNYYTKTKINPFLNYNQSPIETTLINNYSAGIRNSLEGAKIEFIGTYQNITNMLLFIPSKLDKRTFETVYGDGKNIKLEANIRYQILPQIEISGNLVKNFYELSNYPKAWHTPDLTANFTTKTDLLNNKLSITGELFFATAPWYLDLEGNKKKLSPLFDISGKASYKIAKSSNLFLEVNNLFNQKYRKWYQYPSYGINILAGLELSF